jgi:glycine hydroxymethyltransferase
MGVLEVAGKGAERFLDLVTTNYVPRLRDQQCQYSYVLDPSGGVMDDIIVYRRGAERFMVVVNAANAEKILTWFQAVNARDVMIDDDDARMEVDATPAIRDLKHPSAGADRRVDLAFQGPRSLEVLAQVCDRPDLARRLAQLDRFEMAEGTVGAGIDLVIARTGYTGEEQGFEVFVHPDRARELFLLLLERGASVGVKPTGLGARDSTRTEAGFPLYGHELAGSLDISPFGAGYPGFVKLHKPFFVGREATLRREAERRSEIVRLELAGAQVRAVRPGDPVVDGRGRCVGSITSACYVGASQIALAYVERDSLREGARVAVFTLPRDGKSLAAEKAKDRLGTGDRVLLPIDGKVLPRFASKAERDQRNRAVPLKA